MQFSSFLLLAISASAVVASPVKDAKHGVPAKYKKGFLKPKVVDSVGGKATCIVGDIPVTATSTKNVKYNFELPANQTAVTEIFVEFLQIQSPLAKRVAGPLTTVSGTFNINAALCYPKSGLNATTVQILTHGLGFSKGYWNFASEAYSYVDAAAKAGYATLSYDRLGTGKSDHPDPVQVVQTPLEVAIAKELIHILRKGKIASTSFKHVVSVGHSFGSIITQGITAESPELLDAAVLTGFSTSGTGQPAFFSGLDFTIARHTPPKRFKGLNNGYIVAANSIGNQFAFLRAQGFPPRNLDVAEATKDTITFGELFNLTQPIARATSYTGPVDVVNGDADFAFCQGNCRVPVNQAANVLTALYPNASKKSQYYLADNAGHGLNAHYTAPKAYAQIMKFIKSNGL